MLCTRRSLLLLLLVLAGTVRAEQPRAPVTAEHLTALGTSARHLRNYRDNHFLYSDKFQQLAKFAQSLEGQVVELDVAVEMVTTRHVYVKILPTGFTIVSFAPHPQDRVDCPPNGFPELSTYLDYFSSQYSQRHRRYMGPPSTMRYNVISTPDTIRIGDGVQAKFAKYLRNKDRFTVRATVKAIDMAIPSNFVDDTVVFLADPQVIEDSLQPGVNSQAAPY